MMVLPLYVDPTELCMRLTIRLFINNRDGCRTIFILPFIILLFFCSSLSYYRVKKKNALTIGRDMTGTTAITRRSTNRRVKLVTASDALHIRFLIYDGRKKRFFLSWMMQRGFAAHINWRIFWA